MATKSYYKIARPRNSAYTRNNNTWFVVLLLAVVVLGAVAMYALAM
jgi:hypothetical protein